MNLKQKQNCREFFRMMLAETNGNRKLALHRYKCVRKCEMRGYDGYFHHYQFDSMSISEVLEVCKAATTYRSLLEQYGPIKFRKGTKHEFKDISRVEVIDHESDEGRVYVNYGYLLNKVFDIEINLQDDNKTMKIFILKTEEKNDPVS